MLSALPAQFGVPGGPELLIVLLVLVLLSVPVAVVAAAVALFYRRGSAKDERIAELEAEVERLRERIDDDDAESEE